MSACFPMNSRKRIILRRLAKKAGKKRRRLSKKMMTTGAEGVFPPCCRRKRKRRRGWKSYGRIMPNSDMFAMLCKRNCRRRLPVPRLTARLRLSFMNTAIHGGQ